VREGAEGDETRRRARRGGANAGTADAEERRGKGGAKKAQKRPPEGAARGAPQELLDAHIGALEAEDAERGVQSEREEDGRSADFHTFTLSQIWSL
jgi:hypothetical protein